MRRIPALTLPTPIQLLSNLQIASWPLSAEGEAGPICDTSRGIMIHSAPSRGTNAMETSALSLSRTAWYICLIPIQERDACALVDVKSRRPTSFARNSAQLRRFGSTTHFGFG